MVETAKDFTARFRTNSELWDEYRRRLDGLGTDASTELREVMLWQLGYRGARRPRRLDVDE